MQGRGVHHVEGAERSGGRLRNDGLLPWIGVLGSCRVSRIGRGDCIFLYRGVPVDGSLWSRSVLSRNLNRGLNCAVNVGRGLCSYGDWNTQGDLVGRLHRRY